jgi:hypothetical protein
VFPSPNCCQPTQHRFAAPRFTFNFLSLLLPSLTFIMPINPNLPNAIESLIQRGMTESITKSFSGAYPFDPATTTQVVQALGTATPTGFRQALYANPDIVSQYLFVHQNQIHCITRPVITTTDAGVVTHVASMSDIIGDCIPIEFSSEDFTGSFTSLIPAAVVTELGLPHAAEPPDTIPGPGPDGVEPSNARLNYGGTVTVIASLPKFFPVPKGVHLPASPWMLTDNKIEVTSACPAIEHWRQAQHYAAVYNEGLSVTTGGPLMDLAGIAVDQFRDHISTTASTHVRMVHATSPHYAQVKAIIKTFTRSTCLHLGGLLPSEPPVPAGAPAPPGQHFDPDQVLQLVTTLTQGTRPTIDKERTKVAADTAHKFQLLFAHLAPSEDPGGEPTVVPGILNPEFVKFLDTSTRPTAIRALLELITIATNVAAASSHRLDADANFSIDLVDGMLTTGLQTFNFTSENVIDNPSRLTSKISLFCFADPATESTRFQARIQNGVTISSQEAVGEATAKMAAKASEYYIGGYLATGNDVQQTVHNFRLICRIICSDFDLSELGKAVLAYEDILHSRPGKAFIKRAMQHPQVALNMLAELQDIFAGFINIASTPEYRTALQTQDAISPKAYQNANKLGEQIATTLYTAVQRANLMAYREIPSCRCLCFV